LEVRSSLYLHGQFERETKEQQQTLRKEAMRIRHELLTYDYIHLSETLKEELLAVNDETIDRLSFRLPSKRIQNRTRCDERLHELKDIIKRLQKREQLSFTPKLEDIKLVGKWIEAYGVPHYYVQVFFDSIFGLSFSSILNHMINHTCQIEEDVKNQGKTTIKIAVEEGIKLASIHGLPCHQSQIKVLPKGRILSYVTYEPSVAIIDIPKFLSFLE
jgi:hypothetical protein